MVKSSSRIPSTVRGKTHYIVIRKFTGRQTMAEAFGQLVEKKAYEYFEKKTAGNLSFARD